jgi:ADP-ribose pyrophosphatase YjhB (NUDIX family)
MNAPGVGCGAAIVSDGRLLLVKRLRAPEAGHWNLPGGKVDFGERIEHAVMREIHEEVGLDIELTRLLAIVEMIGIDGQHWVSPTYEARVLSGEALNNEPEKLADVAWFPLDVPPAPLALAARRALEALRTI